MFITDIIVLTKRQNTFKDFGLKTELLWLKNFKDLSTQLYFQIYITLYIS